LELWKKNQMAIENQNGKWLINKRMQIPKCYYIMKILIKWYYYNCQIYIFELLYFLNIEINTCSSL